MPNLVNNSVYWCIIIGALDVIHLRPVNYVAIFQKLFSMWPDVVLGPRLSLGGRDDRRGDHDDTEH